MYSGLLDHRYLSRLSFIPIGIFNSGKDITGFVKVITHPCGIISSTLGKEITMSVDIVTQIAKLMGPTWGPPVSCRPQMGPMLAPWILLLGKAWACMSDMESPLSILHDDVMTRTCNSTVHSTACAIMQFFVRWMHNFVWRVYSRLPSQVSNEFWSLQWRHNGRDIISNHQPHHCLLNRLFRRRSKKTSKLRVTGLCVGN